MAGIAQEKSTVRVIAAGIGPELAAWLGDRVPTATVPLVRSGEELLDEARRGGASVVVIDHVLEGPTGPEVLRRWNSEGLRIPVVYCIDPADGRRRVEELVSGLGVDTLLLHPIDRAELLRAVVSLGGIADPAEDAKPSRRRRTADAIALIWEGNKSGISAQVDVLEDAVASLLEGSLPDDLREKARGNAHKLAGSVGTFGFADGSALAREMELIFQNAAMLDDAKVFRLAELVVQLRTELSRDIAQPAPDSEGIEEMEAGAGEVGPLVLISSQDSQLASRLAAEATARGMRTVTTADVYSARDAAELEQPDVALLDFALRGGTSAELRLLEQLEAFDPAVPALVFTSSEVFTDRVEVARRGGRGFLDKKLDAKTAIDSAFQLLAISKRQPYKVLAVDDDPDVLRTLDVVLSERGLNVATLDDPTKFWELLEEVVPDLVVVDVDMPHISGVELCRVIRNDPRWAAVPVLFLTAAQDPEVVNRIFSAGADDYLVKPLIGPDVVTRVENRLDRLQLYRNLVESDQQTGVANRRRSTDVLNGYLRLAERYQQPMSLAVLDVDGLKAVNDEHGHHTGDRVMRKIGDILQKTFRGEDVVARWAGDEFVLGMYGMLRDDGVQRIAEVLEAIRPLEFAGADGKTFRVTFSGGVAQFPDDGGDVHGLYRAADRAVLAAKNAGRDRVLPTGWDPDKGSVIERCDVVLIEDDDALAELLLHSLDTRGYRTHWIRDGAEAVEVLGGDTPHLRARVLLLDVNLPGMDGLGVLRKLSQDDALRGTRVIMLTVRSNELEVVKALELGAFDHVAKPFSIPVLVQRIRRALGRQ
jgi:diguanylate cyclase (GGDEF)-like protein